MKACLDGNKNYDHDMETLFELEKQGKALLIFPKKKPPIGRSEKSEKKLEAFYQTGYNVGKEYLLEVKRFLGETDA